MKGKGPEQSGKFHLIKKPWQKFFESFFEYRPDFELKRRIFLVIFLSIIGIVNLVPLGIVALFEGNIILGIADLLAAVALLLNLVHARQKKQYRINSWVGVSIVALLFTYLKMTGGVNNSASVWYFTFPLIASFILGSLAGVVAGALLLVPVLLQQFLSLPQPFFTRYDPDFELRFVMAYLVVLLFAYLFERTRENHQNELRSVHETLEEKVDERTREISKANQQLEREAEIRRNTARALEESEKKYRMITESTSDLIAIATLDTNPVFKFISPSHRKVVGFNPGYLQGKSALKPIHPDDRKVLISVLKDYLGDGKKRDQMDKDLKEGITIEYRVKGVENSWRFLRSTVNQIDGDLLFISKDITDQKQAEAQLEKALSEKNVLLKEIHHRVKNNLQVIVSLLGLQMDRLEDEKSISTYENCISRVRSMALIHEKLYQSDNLAKINFSDYVATLCRELLTSRGNPANITVNLDFEDIEMAIEKSINWGLIVNEIVSNALKHAFLPHQPGSIDVRFHLAETNHYELTVRDDGCGLPADLDIHHTETLGLRLIKILTDQLDGTISVTGDSGTTFIIQVPV